MTTGSVNERIEKSPITQYLREHGFTDEMLNSINLSPKYVKTDQEPTGHYSTEFGFNEQVYIKLNEHSFYVHFYAKLKWVCNHSFESKYNSFNKLLNAEITIAEKNRIVGVSKRAVSTKNKTNAQKDRRKKPTKDQLLEFQANFKAIYLERHGVETDRGWKKAAIYELKISSKTLNKILE